MIICPTMQACEEIIFPLIKRHMASLEPAPQYNFERRGLQKLESILHFMTEDHYPTFLSKAAYMFCSVIGGHPFSNGNKRLAVALLSYFLIYNDYAFVVENAEELRKEFQKLFPHLKWEEVNAFHLPHEFFLYHLALVIADRSQKGRMTFTEERAAVEAAIDFVTAKTPTSPS